MTPAPIVLFVYNRPEHTLKVLDALNANDLSDESHLFIFCDGPKKNTTESDLKKIKEVEELVNQKKWCKSVTLFKSEENKGLANSIIDGVTEIIRRYGTAIILEDDIVTSIYFLQFMNEALQKYSEQSNVACISGYIYPVKAKLPETFFIKGADCWGWATWKRAWDSFEKDGNKLLKQLEENSLKKQFDFDDSYPYVKMLEDQIAGKNNSWAIRWYASAFLKNNLCLYPGVSLVQNIGNDGSGTHNGDSEIWDVNLTERKVHVGDILLEENLFSKKIMTNYFKSLTPTTSTFSYSILVGIKKIITPFYRKFETINKEFRGKAVTKNKL